MATDWTKIRTKYVAGKMSLKALAEKEGLSYSMLSKQAAADSWAQRRKDYREKVAKKSLARAGAREVDRLDKVIRATERTVDTALEAISDEKQFFKHLVTENGETVEREYGKIDTKALKNMASALTDLTKLLREFYGIAPAYEPRELSEQPVIIMTPVKERR